VVVYFLHAARTAVTKTGTTDFVYEFVGTAAAIPTKTLSITIIRNGQVFAYTGVVVSSFTINVDSGVTMFSASLVGRNEATQSAPTPTFPDTEPFGEGSYDIQVDAATITDADTFSFQVEDNGAAQNRLKSTRGAAFVSYGERNVTVSMDRDFDTRADYDAFKALTARALHFEANKGAANYIHIDVPVGVRSEYAVNLGGQGDLIRVSNSFTGVIDDTGNAYTVTIGTQEDVS
jgi:hypothetical protein